MSKMGFGLYGMGPMAIHAIDAAMVPKKSSTHQLFTVFFGGDGCKAGRSA